MASSSKNMDSYSIDMCPICYDFNSELFYKLFTCGHIICRICLVKYLKNEINESRTDIGEYIAYMFRLSHWLQSGVFRIDTKFVFWNLRVHGSLELIWKI